MELGVGCRQDAIRPARVGGRSHLANSWVLSGADGHDGGGELGVGYGSMDGNEVFQARQDSNGELIITIPTRPVDKTSIIWPPSD